MKSVLLLCVLQTFCEALFPRESESREIKVLDGLWNFRADKSDNRNEGFEKKWYSKALKKSGDIIKMPVPSSYNDITQDRTIRDFVGWVWYDREFFVSASWNDDEYIRVVMRFESCHYYCIVWVNGEKLMEHDGGHLPFESDVSHLLIFGESNTITVAANNTLTPTTLPPGAIDYLVNRRYPPGYFVQTLQMDFFNYAGIHRQVKLYTTPTVHLLDINLDTDFEDSTGVLNFTSSVAALEGGKNSYNNISMRYEIYNEDGEQVANISGNNLFKSTMKVPNVNLWWPVDMGHKPGYMYNLQVTVAVKDIPQLTDVYRIPFGFRTVDIVKDAFKINDKPFYFKGFGMHEDSDIRGKGLDLPTITKNFNLIDWMGGNSFRTSHYPYADEIMEFADRQGIVVIDESPGVGIQRENMKEVNIEKHKNVMKELIHRDKNHPSVVMWSVANEPESQYEEAENYFKKVIEYTRELDRTRPVTFVGNQSPYDDKAVQFNDVICYNKYYAWYHDFGHLELIEYQIESDFNLWYNITGKPLIMSEYGADAVSGLYQNPPVMFTEDFQVEAVKNYFPLFDKFRRKFLIGEMIWNFADFATDQSTTRVAGNKKGIFTRQRQPKRVAYVLRERYRNLSSEVKDKETRSHIESPIESQEGYNLNFVVV